MSLVIPADITLSQSLGEKLVHEQFPGLKTVPFKKLGEGFDNLVLQGEGLVFRFPRRQSAVALTEREITILDFLKGKLSVEAPVPEYRGSPTEAYPYPFYGHKVLEGLTGDQVSLSAAGYNKVAEKLGTVLQKIHSFDLSELPRVDLTPFDDRTQFEKKLEILWERVKPVQKKYDLEKYFPEWLKVIESASSYKASESPCLIHGDLYHKHMIFSSEGNLKGLIDWGDVCVNDPVVDLAVCFQFFPAESQSHFWDSYGPVSEQTKLYARFVALYCAVCMLWFGDDREDKSLIPFSLKVLKGETALFL